MTEGLFERFARCGMADGCDGNVDMDGSIGTGNPSRNFHGKKRKKVIPR